MKHILAIAIIATLAGCMTTTDAELRVNSAGKEFTFIAPQNYQVVYRKILDQTRKCSRISFILGGHTAVEGDLYSDLRAGTVSVGSSRLEGYDTGTVIDIAAIDEQQSKVTTYAKFDTKSWTGKRVKAWVIDNATECNP